MFNGIAEHECRNRDLFTELFIFFYCFFLIHSV